MGMMLRVKKGAAILDQKFPDWIWRINIDELDIQNSKYCVLGQLFGSYTKGLKKIGFDNDWKEYHYGFLDITGVLLPQWFWNNVPNWFGVKLSKCWKKYLIQRRESEKHSFEKFENERSLIKVYANGENYGESLE